MCLFKYGSSFFAACKVEGLIAGGGGIGVKCAMDYRELSVDNPFYAPVYYVGETDSTMRLARELASEGVPDGTLIVAGYQSAGRGRIEGRTWVTTRDENLLCTAILRRKPIAGFTLRVGLAVAESFRRFLPENLEVKIKWPNDVLVLGKKVSGILCESDGDTLYVGTGFNLGQRDFNPNLSAKAASLATLMPGKTPPTPTQMLTVYLPELRKVLEMEDWNERVTRSLLYRGERIRFLQGDPAKEEWIDGTVEAIGSAGELLLKPDASAGPVCCATTLRLFSGEIPYPNATP